MLCKNCKSEWKTDGRVSSSLTVCPFCGEKLEGKETPEFFDKSLDALCFIAARYGTEVLLGTSVASYFSDVAPCLKVEKELIKSLQVSGALIVLKSHLNSSMNDQETAIKQATGKLPSYMDKAVVENILHEFTTALGWQSSEQILQPRQHHRRQQLQSSITTSQTPFSTSQGQQGRSSNFIGSFWLPDKKAFASLIIIFLGLLILISNLGGGKPGNNPIKKDQSGLTLPVTPKNTNESNISVDNQNSNQKSQPSYTPKVTSTAGPSLTPIHTPEPNMRLLHDLAFSSASSTNGGFRFYDMVKDNYGTMYSNGLGGLYSDKSWQEYDVSNYKYIAGRIVLDYDSRTQIGKNAFLWIYGDDINIYMSPEINAGMEPIDFKVDISDVNLLKVMIQGTNMLRLVDCVLLKEEDDRRFSTAIESTLNASSDYAYLSKLDWYNASYSRGGFEYYDVVKDNFGTIYSNGIGGTNGFGNSFQSYKINGQFSKMTGMVVLDYDSRTNDNDEVYLWIYGNNKLLYKSPMITAGVNPTSFEISLKEVTDLKVELYGTKMLRLVDCVLYRTSEAEKVSSAQTVQQAYTSSKIYLGKLDWYNASYSGGGFEYYDVVKDNFGTIYSNGIGGTNGFGNSFQSYKINGQFSKMTGMVVLDYDSRTNDNDEVYLWIYGNNKLLYKSPMITAGVNPTSFEISLKEVTDLKVELYGTKMLRLVDCILYK